MAELSQQYQHNLGREALLAAIQETAPSFRLSTPGFNDNPTPMLISNAASIIVDANQSALTLLKYSREEIVGVSTENLWGTRVSYRATAGQGIITPVIEAQLRDKNGSIHPVLVSFETIEQAGRSYKLVVAYDITQLKREKSYQGPGNNEMKEHNQEVVRLRSELARYAEEANTRRIELQQAKDKLETILESISDIIIVVDSNGLVRQTNLALTTVLGYDPDRLISQPIANLPIFEDDAVARAVLSVGSTGKPRRLEVQVRHQDGHRIYVELDIVRGRTRTLGTHQIICTLHDITAWKEMEAEFRKTPSDEHRSDEMNTRFLAMLSHEFRTPLTVISTMVSTLLQFHDRLSLEKRVTSLRRIEEQGNRLLQITNDMLMLSRTDALNFSYTPAPLDLRDFCDTLIQDVKLALGTNNQVNLEYEGDGDVVYLDENLVCHILTNLTSNAIKYSSPESIITVRICCTQEHVTLKVIDYGIGIPQQNQKNIFDAFQRAGNVGAITGTGLGLTIVRYAVTAHQGKIDFESYEGKGTTFTVTLPNNKPCRNGVSKSRSLAALQQ